MAHHSTLLFSIYAKLLSLFHFYILFTLLKIRPQLPLSTTFFFSFKFLGVTPLFISLSNFLHFLFRFLHLTIRLTFANFLLRYYNLSLFSLSILPFHHFTLFTPFRLFTFAIFFFLLFQFFILSLLFYFSSSIFITFFFFYFFFTLTFLHLSTLFFYLFQITSISFKK